MKIAKPSAPQTEANRNEHVTAAEIEHAFYAAASACRKHAAHCQACFIPIMDAEGNPGMMSEACASGSLLLEIYNKREAAMFNLLDSRKAS